MNKICNSLKICLFLKAMLFSILDLDYINILTHLKILGLFEMQETEKP